MEGGKFVWKVGTIVIAAIRMQSSESLLVGSPVIVTEFLGFENMICVYASSTGNLDIFLGLKSLYLGKTVEE